MPRQATDDAQWHAAIADFRRSGLTQPEFCRRRRLPLHTFRRRLYARPGVPPKGIDNDHPPEGCGDSGLMKGSGTAVRRAFLAR